jgi:hypothetical protein
MTDFGVFSAGLGVGPAVSLMNASYDPVVGHNHFDTNNGGQLLMSYISGNLSTSRLSGNIDTSKLSGSINVSTITGNLPASQISGSVASASNSLLLNGQKWVTVISDTVSIGAAPKIYELRPGGSNKIYQYQVYGTNETVVTGFASTLTCAYLVFYPTSSNDDELVIINRDSTQNFTTKVWVWE